MSANDTPKTKFNALLHDQIGHEFTASQQYIAIAAYFDDADLPQLAAHFYKQAVEERNHAMMIVRYLIDRRVSVEIPPVGAVTNGFTAPREPLALALAQEQTVTEQVTELARTARDEGDY
ncbi:ferritin, partial [Mycobacteroides chelonae]